MANRSQPTMALLVAGGDTPISRPPPLIRDLPDQLQQFTGVDSDLSANPILGKPFHQPVGASDADAEDLCEFSYGHKTSVALVRAHSRPSTQAPLDSIFLSLS